MRRDMLHKAGGNEGMCHKSIFYHSLLDFFVFSRVFILSLKKIITQ